MKLVVKCPACHACGEVPDQYIGLRIRCLSCETRFVLGFHELVMTPINGDANAILEYDSIELVACSKCPSLGILINHHASRFFRCPDCKTLCSIGGEAAMPRGTAPAAAAGARRQTTPRAPAHAGSGPIRAG
jgi:hypothetical protein